MGSIFESYIKNCYKRKLSDQKVVGNISMKQKGKIAQLIVGHLVVWFILTTLIHLFAQSKDIILFDWLQGYYFTAMLSLIVLSLQLCLYIKQQHGIQFHFGKPVQKHQTTAGNLLKSSKPLPASPSLLNFSDVDDNSKTTVQKVFVLPESYPKEKQSEHKHFILDGIEQSDKLKLTNDPLDPDAVWIVNAGRYSCEMFQKVLKQRLEFSAAAEIKKTGTQPFSSSQQSQNRWSIVIMDWSDNGVLGKYKPCLENIYKSFCFSNQHTFVATRTIMKGRHVVIDKSDNKTIKIESGQPIDYNFELSTIQSNGSSIATQGANKSSRVPLFTGKVQPIRYGVRSDLVNTINKLTNGVHGTEIVEKVRTGDAIHFWSHESGTNWYCQLRTSVSRAMREFAAEEDRNSKQNVALNIATREIGPRKKAGRNSISDDYAEALLNYKIVVVAQRDEWEGHYRLMEAMAAGAFVLTDPMHPLPCGIIDGKHLVVYTNLTQLKTYLKYYLVHDNERIQIAKNGYTKAMKNHRSWHIMERTIFGDWNKAYCNE